MLFVVEYHLMVRGKSRGSVNKNNDRAMIQFVCKYLFCSNFSVCREFISIARGRVFPTNYSMIYGVVFVVTVL